MGSLVLSTEYEGKDIFLFKLANKNNTEVFITNYGAVICGFKVKQRDGSVNDIVLGFDHPLAYLDSGYLRNYPYFGAAIGRYGNRIKNGRLKIDGKDYQLPVNMGNDHIHGGITGFDKKNWTVVKFDEQNNILELELESPDGEEGYPGNLSTGLTFELNDNDELSYEYHATTDKPTAVNLTHHSYFNLENGNGNVEDYLVKINGSIILEQDSNLTTTGNLVKVGGTQYDFRQFRRISEQEYDQSYVIDKKGSELLLSAEAYSEKSEIKLQVLTTEPVVHFYTGAGIPSITGKNGIPYGPFSGFCLETQKHPNAVNIPQFPNTILRPGEKYYQKTVYRIVHV